MFCGGVRLSLVVRLDWGLVLNGSHRFSTQGTATRTMHRAWCFSKYLKGKPHKSYSLITHGGAYPRTSSEVLPCYHCVTWLKQVYTEREWKKTKYAGKTKTMPEGIADVDMALDKTLVFD